MTTFWFTIASFFIYRYRWYMHIYRYRWPIHKQWCLVLLSIHRQREYVPSWLLIHTFCLYWDQFCDSLDHSRREPIDLTLIDFNVALWWQIWNDTSFGHSRCCYSIDQKSLKSHERYFYNYSLGFRKQKQHEMLLSEMKLLALGDCRFFFCAWRNTEEKGSERCICDLMFAQQYNWQLLYKHFTCWMQKKITMSHNNAEKLIMIIILIHLYWQLLMK